MQEVSLRAVIYELYITVQENECMVVLLTRRVRPRLPIALCIPAVAEPLFSEKPSLRTPFLSMSFFSDGLTDVSSSVGCPKGPPTFGRAITLDRLDDASHRF